jgi:hypothetical protein
MTTDFVDTAEVLGLADAFPRPGWIVLDAVRDRRFTGEVRCNVTGGVGDVTVYADRGVIYLAERADDTSLGARLVDAGVLSAAQLERGAMRVGETEHLGRLFERVPSVDRHRVILSTELMTEECTGRLATWRVAGVQVTPYRHHPSGVHRWSQPVVLQPGDPLPAPPADAAPVASAPPESLFSTRLVDDLTDLDEVIKWNEPSFLDERRVDRSGRAEPNAEGAPPAGAGTAPPPPPPAPEATRVEPTQPPAANHSDRDWITDLDEVGLPEPGSDPLASPRRLPRLTVEPTDRFEVIWPSGEIDEQFGSESIVNDLDPDIDRVGRTARLVPAAGRSELEDIDIRRWLDQPGTQPAARDGGDSGAAPGEPELHGAAPTSVDLDATDATDATDAVVLAVRRAVASIETGSLPARRRLAESSEPRTAPHPEPYSESHPAPQPEPFVLPGRVAVRTDQLGAPASSQVRVMRAVGGSVFDDPAEVPAAEQQPGTTDAAGNDPGQQPTDDQGPPGERASALRRLIGAIRRR